MKKEQPKKEKRTYTIEDRHDKGLKYLKKFDRAYEFSPSRVEDIQENVAFYQGEQYRLAKYLNTERPWVVQMNTPHATLAIQTRVASLIANTYIGTLQPLAPEDVETIKSLNDIKNDIWEETGLDSKINDAIDKGSVTREAYIHIIAQPDKITGGNGAMNKGGFKAYLLDNMSVWLDPSARTFEDCRYIFVTGRIMIDEAYRKYPFLKDEIGEFTSSSPERRGESVVSNDYITSQDDIFAKYTMYEKVYDEDGKLKIYRRTMVEDYLVEEKELKGMKRFPIAQFRWEKSAQSAYGISLMDRVISLQKSINAIESAITNTALAYASPTFVVTKASGINPKIVAKTSGMPGVVFSSNVEPSKSIGTVMNRTLDTELINIKSQYEDTINKIAGVSDEFVGSLGTSGNTAGGSQIAVERAKVIEQLILANISDFVEQITQILVEYIVVAYEAGDPIYTRKLKGNGQTEFNVREMPAGAKDINWSFAVDLEARTKYSRDRESAKMLEMYQMEMQYDTKIKFVQPLDLINGSDLRNKEELIARYELKVKKTDEYKAEILNKVLEISQKYEIPQELVLQAEIELIGDEKEMPAVQQIMQMTEQLDAQMKAQIDQSNQQALEMGVSPQAIAQTQTQAENMKPSDFGIKQ